MIGGTLMAFKNGFIIQDTLSPTLLTKSFDYKGINAYFDYPLTAVNDRQCRIISDKISSRKLEDDEYQILEFISDAKAYREYVKLCCEHGISTRSLFVESDYDREIWNGETPELKFIGYEYCPVPIDDQIITDLDWCENFSQHINKLNEYGMFQNIEDALAFKNDYTEAYNYGIVGDGDLDAHIFKVSIAL